MNSRNNQQGQGQRRSPPQWPYQTGYQAPSEFAFGSNQARRPSQGQDYRPGFQTTPFDGQLHDAFNQLSTQQATSTSITETAQFQQRLHSIGQAVTRQAGVDSLTANTINAEIRSLSQQYNERNQRIHNAHERAVKEREALQSALGDKQRLIQNALAERDRACTERDERSKELNQLQNSHQRYQVDQEAREQELTQEKARFSAQIAFLEEQLAGKRDLWRQYHPSSSTRRSATAPRDPYTTPSNRTTSRARVNTNTSAMGSTLKSRDDQQQTSPTPSNSNLPKMPSPAPQMASLFHESLSSTLPAFPQIPRAPSSIQLSTLSGDEGPRDALVPFKTMDEIAAELTAEIGNTYGKLHAWVMVYATHMNPIADDQSVQEDENAWQFIVSCVPPFKRDDAMSHVIWMLRNVETRPWFVMRLMVEFILRKIWNESAWHGFHPAATRRLEQIEERLSVRGIENTERAQLQDSRKAVIQKIMDSKRFAAFRMMRLSTFVKELRGLVGPMLDQTVPRGAAASALLNLCVGINDLSAKILCSGWTVITEWPEAGDRFLSTKMTCKNSDEDPMSLHLRQARLKLVITPTMTVRDDHKNTITVKQLENAAVLIQT